MKKLFIIVLSLLTSGVFAADLVVEEFGVSPAYPSIAAAVAAANDGDRILIKNRAGDIPWIEDITIDKSLELHSYENNEFFIVQGTYSLQKEAGRVITIVGMQNTVGSIVATSGTGGIGSTEVNIMDSHLMEGYINLLDNTIRANLVGNTLDAGYIRLIIGNVIGNNINSTNQNINAIYLNSYGTFMGDTALVMGNVITGPTSSHYTVHLEATTQVIHFRNNLINYSSYGLYCRTGNGSSAPNLIWNNTFKRTNATSTTYGLQFYGTNSNSIWEVMNNVFAFEGSGSSRGVWDAGSNDGQINVYYNHFQSGMNLTVSTGFTYVGQNTTDQDITLNPDGTINDAPGVVDGANPAPVFYDLDLTPGDAGAYGGSFTLNNFHPLHTGSARVYYVNFPFNVRMGSTLNVKAYSYDR